MAIPYGTEEMRETASGLLIVPCRRQNKLLHNELIACDIPDGVKRNGEEISGRIGLL
jgi:hypothetical protein